jgi:hypothetical protein
MWWNFNEEVRMYIVRMCGHEVVACLWLWQDSNLLSSTVTSLTGVCGRCSWLRFSKWLDPRSIAIYLHIIIRFMTLLVIMRSAVSRPPVWIRASAAFSTHLPTCSSILPLKVSQNMYCKLCRNSPACWPSSSASLACAAVEKSRSVQTQVIHQRRMARFEELQNFRCQR